MGYQNRAEGTICNDLRSLPLPAGGLGRCESPSGSRGQSPLETPGFLHFIQGKV